MLNQICRSSGHLHSALPVLLSAGLTLLAAAPTLGAQGVSVSERPEPNDLGGRTTTILSSDQAEGEIAAPQNGAVDEDAYTFLLTAPQDVYAFTAQGGASGSVEDTVLELYAADGTTLVASDDDGGEGKFSRLGPLRLQPGTYHLNVKPKGADTVVGNYTLDLVSLPLSNPPISLCGGTLSPAFEALEPNAGPTLARDVQHCTRVFGTIDTSGGDQDWYRLLTTQPLIVSADSTSACGTLADAGLRIWDSTGTQVLYEDDQPGALSRIEARLTPSTYYISIDGGAADANGSYCLDLRCSIPGTNPVGDASVSVSGTGCPTSTGPAPQMMPRVGEGARIGSIFSIDCINLPPAGSTAFAIVGFREENIDLSVTGAIGCTLLTNTVVIQNRPSVLGISDFSVRIDPLAQLIGTRFHIQFAAIDIAANGLGLVFSDRATGTIGL